MSYAEAAILRELVERVAALEQLTLRDPLIDRVQRLEMRVQSLQGQINLLKVRAPVAPPDASQALVLEHEDAAAG